MTILPFEPPLFEAEGLATTFVGNPALSPRAHDGDPEAFRRAIGAASGELILLVAPGSRPSEIERMIPPFEEGVARLKRLRPELHVVVPAASTVAETVKTRVAAWPFRARVVEDESDKAAAMAAADVALACSGTVTTQLALAGVPMVVAYRTGAVTYQVLKRLVRTSYITLFNIAAGRAVAPELIQHDCTGAALARELELRLAHPELRERQRIAQCAALNALGRGGPDPAEASADVVIRMLEERGRL